MYFVAVMLFTHQVFHLKCLFFFLLLLIRDTCYYFGSNLRLVLLMKVLFMKKVCNVVFQSSKNEEMTLPHEFIFLLIRYFIGTKLSRKFVKSDGFSKKTLHYHISQQTINEYDECRKIVIPYLVLNSQCAKSILYIIEKISI